MKSDYNSLSKDLNSMQKQIIFRSCNMGMLELDVIVGKWAK
jgi:succinate dehydrogenase flavin-adding protein (antitoxin of CptAB toxin-antitoxin module)